MRDRRTEKLLSRLAEASAAYKRVIDNPDSMSVSGKANACALVLTLYGHLFAIAENEIRDLTR